MAVVRRVKIPWKKQMGDIAKSKKNSFYGKMIENLDRHKYAKFTRDELVVDKACRFPLFWQFGRYC